MYNAKPSAAVATDLWPPQQQAADSLPLRRGGRQETFRKVNCEVKRRSCPTAKVQSITLSIVAFASCESFPFKNGQWTHAQPRHQPRWRLCTLCFRRSFHHFAANRFNMFHFFCATRSAFALLGFSTQRRLDSQPRGICVSTADTTARVHEP